MEKTIKELGYRPNHYARTLASKTSRTIGVIVNRFASTYYGQMLEGVETALEVHGYKTIAESSRESAKGEQEALTSLLDRQCDAIVMHTNQLTDAQLRPLLQEKQPIILLNRHLEGYCQRCIYLDNEAAGERAANYLLDCGHRQIAMITGSDEFHEALARTKGFRRAFEKRGLELNEDLVVKSRFGFKGGYDGFKQLQKRAVPYTAIFFQSDEMAIAGIEAAQEYGLSAPADFSVLGFDDVEAAQYLTPKLTTMRQPLNEIGKAAGLLALAEFTGKQEFFDGKREFEATVKQRASVTSLGS